MVYITKIIVGNCSAKCRCLKGNWTTCVSVQTALPSRLVCRYVLISNDWQGNTNELFRHIPYALQAHDSRDGTPWSDSTFVYNTPLNQSRWKSKNALRLPQHLLMAMCYKPEGRVFYSRWCHWNFSSTQSFRPHYGPRVDPSSNRNE